MQLRFSVRDLSWLMLIVAILLVWWMDHRRLAVKNRFTVETIRLSDGEPIFLRDNQLPGVGYIRDAEGWKASWIPGQPPPVFIPEE
jgi:hypothetical protein